METGIKEGIEAATIFVGKFGPTKVFMLEAGGESSAYDAVLEDFCDWTDAGSWCNDDAMRSDAMSCCTVDGQTCHGEIDGTTVCGAGQFYASGRSTCACSEFITTGIPLIFSPMSFDSAQGAKERAVHEYIHSMQKAMGGNIPAW